MPLTSAQLAFLDGINFAVVATLNPDGSPQLTVVWYLREGNELVFNTAAGRLKHRNLLRDPRLSATVLSADGYRYITAKGSATLDDASGQDVIYRLAVRYDGEQEAIRQMRDQFSKEQRVTFRLPLTNTHTYGFDE